MDTNLNKKKKKIQTKFKWTESPHPLSKWMIFNLPGIPKTILSNWTSTIIPPTWLRHNQREAMVHWYSDPRMFKTLQSAKNRVERIELNNKYWDTINLENSKYESLFGQKLDDQFKSITNIILNNIETIDFSSKKDILEKLPSIIQEVLILQSSRVDNDSILENKMFPLKTVNNEFIYILKGCVLRLSNTENTIDIATWLLELLIDEKVENRVSYPEINEEFELIFNKIYLKLLEQSDINKVVDTLENYRLNGWHGMSEYVFKLFLEIKPFILNTSKQLTGIELQEFNDKVWNLIFWTISYIQDFDLIDSRKLPGLTETINEYLKVDWISDEFWRKLYTTNHLIKSFISDDSTNSILKRSKLLKLLGKNGFESLMLFIKK